MLNVLKIENGVLSENCYIVYEEGARECAVIDPGAQAGKINDKLSELGLHPRFILLTHGHFDHIGAVDGVSCDDTVLYIHEEDECMLTDAEKNESVGFGVPPLTVTKKAQTVKEGDIISLGNSSFTVLHTPGHSRGSVCYDTGDMLFTGDTMFENGYGRTDLWGSDFGEMKKSLHRLFPLRKDRKIFPGHS